MLYSAWSGVSSVHVVLSVLGSRSLSFVHLSMSCRHGCMLAFAMFMSVCGAVIVMSSAYVISAYSWWNCQVPKISAYSWWNCQGSKDLGPLVVELSGDTQSPANRDQLLS